MLSNSIRVFSSAGAPKDLLIRRLVLDHQTEFAVAVDALHRQVLAFPEETEGRVHEESPRRPPQENRQLPVELVRLQQPTHMDRFLQVRRFVPRNVARVFDVLGGFRGGECV